MSMKLLSCEINIQVLSPGVIPDNGGIESLKNSMNIWFRIEKYSTYVQKIVYWES
jgi:hypothetical protein